MTAKEREELIDKYLHKEIDVVIDRQIGYINVKPTHSVLYPINYGYIDGVLGGDDEFLDVYILGVNKPLETFHGKVIAAVIRMDDVEDKLVACPLDMTFSKEEIEKSVNFAEKFHESHIRI